MGTNLMRALLLTSASVAMAATTAPTAAYAQEATYQIDIPAQSMGDALRALGKATKQNIVFSGSVVKGKRSAAVRGRMSAGEALDRMLAGSGLKMSRGSGGGLVVLGGNGSGPSPASGASAARPANGSSTGRSIVQGRVADIGTGAALKGAQVEIVETGMRTATDDLGQFRFPGVKPGNYTVRVSFLGYREESLSVDVDGAGSEVEFKLIGGNEREEIVVYGQRSARAQAINQERTAENTQTVVSSDLLGQFDGATIADALRRVPGVAFQQDPVTGDGSNVIVRGLSPDYNTVTLNGLRLPEGSGTGRSPNLSNILTDSIAKVTISKTLLPNQDSSGTGGLIDIETKGPLDRARRYANFGVEGVRTGKGFQKEFSVNGTVSATFGADENFGVSASVQYRKRNIQRYDYSVINNGLFPYLPLDANGNPITSKFDIDSNTKYPFEPGVDAVYPDSVSTGYNGANGSNLAITLSAQWKIGTHTNLRFDYVRSSSKRDEFARSTSFNPFEGYRLLPVDELGGEVRGVLVSHDYFAGSGFTGTLLNAGQTYTFQNGVKGRSDIYSFQGQTDIDNWELRYSGGYTDGSSTIPLTGRLSSNWLFNSIGRLVQSSSLSEAAFDNLNSGGTPLSIFAPLGGNHFPAPLLNQEGFGRLSDPSSWTLDPVNGASFVTGSGGSNKRYTAKGSVRYNFSDSALRYVEAGGFFESSKFSNRPVVGSQGFSITPAAFTDRISYSDLGLAFSGTSLDPIGIAGGPSVVSREDIENFFKNVSDVLAQNPDLVRSDFSATDPRRQATFLRENNFSFYVMPRVDIGTVELVGGVRVDRVDIRTRGLLNPRLVDAGGNDDANFAITNSQLADGTAKNTAILPRFAATWRVRDDLLVRASFGKSVARPQVQFLTGAQDLTFYLQPLYGPNGNQPQLTVQKTNPDLKPAMTNNYDLGIEKYFSDAGQVKLSFFYKSIENLVGFGTADSSNSLDGVTIPADPRLADLSGFFVQTVQQINGDNPAKVYGLELAVEKQFTFLPGALGGFGFYGNYTYTKGDREFQTVENGQNVRRNVPLTGAPRHSGTAALTYNKYGFDATLAYTMQGRRFDGYGNFGFDIYSEADSSLDFRAEYRFNPGLGQWRVWVEASDLLKGPHDADVISTQGGADGVPKIYTGGNYYGGRRGTLGLAVSF